MVVKEFGTNEERGKLREVEKTGPPTIEIEKG